VNLSQNKLIKQTGWMPVLRNQFSSAEVKYTGSITYLLGSARSHFQWKKTVVFLLRIKLKTPSLRSRSIQYSRTAFFRL